MSRFFVDQSAVGQTTIAITSPDDIRHIAKVLRLSPGDSLELSDSKAFEYETEILSIERDKIEVRILDKQRFAREPQIQVTLFQGIPKQGKLEVIIQKSVELGVHEIVPVYTKRTVALDKGAGDKKAERWQRISDEAVKQCRRGIPPKVRSPRPFQEIGEELKRFDQALIPYENEEGRTIKDALRSVSVKPKTLALVIGPEGGFSQEEVETARGAGCLPVSLGRTILRTETAGPAALAMVMYELEL